MAFLSLQRGLTSSILPQINTFTRTLVTKVVTRPVPPLRDPNTLPPTVPRFPGMDVIRGPQDFLKAIGREADTKVTAESWEELWKLNGQAMRKAGLSVRDRRYILWCMEKYRRGFPIQEFAHDATPKKTIRGWGPKVQNGKRIRSRRLKDKTRK